MNKYSNDYNISDDGDYLDDDDYNYDEDLEKYWDELEKESTKEDIKHKKTIKSHSYEDKIDDDY